MINEALNCLIYELNSWCQSNTGLSEAPAVLAAIVNPDGSLPLHTANKIIITLVNIETDPGLRNNILPNKNFEEAGIAPVNLNGYILLTANFENYETALKMLFAAISFLHQKSFFNKSNTTSLPETIENFSIEMVNLDFENLHHLWATLGAKYMPSVVYKMRIQFSYATS